MPVSAHHPLGPIGIDSTSVLCRVLACKTYVNLMHILLISCSTRHRIKRDATPEYSYVDVSLHEKTVQQGQPTTDERIQTSSNVSYEAVTTNVISTRNVAYGVIGSRQVQGVVDDVQTSDNIAYHATTSNMPSRP